MTARGPLPAAGRSSQPWISQPSFAVPAIGLGAAQGSEIGCRPFRAHAADGRHLSAPEHGEGLGREEALQGDRAIAGRGARAHEGKIALAAQRGLRPRPQILCPRPSSHRRAPAPFEGADPGDQHLGLALPGGEGGIDASRIDAPRRAVLHRDEQSDRPSSTGDRWRRRRPGQGTGRSARPRASRSDPSADRRCGPCRRQVRSAGRSPCTSHSHGDCRRRCRRWTSVPAQHASQGLSPLAVRRRRVPPATS